MMNFFKNQTLSPFAVLLAMLLWVSNACSTELSARVDRQVISENETLQLTLRVNEQVGYSSPDFASLKQDFDILSQQRSSQFRNINGNTEAWTDWTLILAPKITGTLTIPTFKFQGAVSKPVRITVTQASATATSQLQDIFVEVETDKPSVFVQEQLLVTIKIYTGILLRDASMNQELSVENAVVQTVSETAYHKQLNGRAYRVMELVYAVYPQKSEPITIPSLSWDLVVATDHGNGLRYRFQTGETRRLRSEAMTIPVRAKPAQYTGTQWLPASEVTLEQHWSSDPSRFVVGEPLTRTVTLRAQGLTSAQLPPLPDQSIDGIKVYSDQPQFDDTKDSKGIAGHRIESIAIMPTRAGKLTLPEMRISWWDTLAQQERVATLPPQVLTIAPAAAANASLPLAPSAPLLTGTSADSELASNPAANWPWLISNGVFAGLALFFLLAWLRTRGQQQKLLGKRQTQKQAITKELDGAFHAIRRACSENDARTVRNALGEWGRLYWHLPHTASLQNIIQRCDADPLAKELAELDKILYGCQRSLHDKNTDWNGNTLWRALVKFKRNDKKKLEQEQTEKSQLPPLYPDGI
jgi:hypothetical protein